MQPTSRLLLAIAGLSFLTACVPQRQFEDMKNKRKQCETDLLEYTKKNTEITTQNQLLDGQVKDLDKKLGQLQRDTSRLGDMNRKVNANYDRLTDTYERLIARNKDLLGSSTSERDRLEGQLGTTKAELEKKESKLKELERSLEKRERDLDKVTADNQNKQAELATKEARVRELERTIRLKDSTANVLKNKVSDALLGLQGKGLTITQKDGKVYVALDESLLFAAGKTEVDPKGKDAIIKLSKVLEREQDINILIEGHTDNVPMKSALIKDNWDLSVMRATAISRIIQENSSVDPRRLLPAGRGEYYPVDLGNSPEARKKNRRTEIILTPKLDELMKLLENK